MRALLDWLDQRTGYRKLLGEALYENIPGGSRWRYVWGSALTFTLFIQIVTGIFLWIAYSPSAQTAWESVFYIQHEMSGGWLLRGLHHYTAQAMNILLVLHLMQVIIDGAYKAPREINFWFGLIMLQLVLALSLTGYLLPWDQKGFWATKVTTSIVSIVPVIGPSLERLVVGGADYGHHTLTRFFALHAGVLPGMLVLLLVGHIYLFRRHGITAKTPYRKPDQKFWPEQVLKDAVACLAVLAAVLFLILRPRLFGGSELLGAELTAPAEPSEAYSAARPEWYFLFLFQLLKYFPGKTEIIGAIIIPGLLMTVVCLMPFLGRWRLGHRFNLCFLLSLLAGAGMLTYLAMEQDANDPIYQSALREADRNAQRVTLLAQSPSGIPVSGAVTLLRTDPLTQGPKIFAKNCAGCHRFDGHDALGNVLKDPPTAPDLSKFASREWLSGLLDPARIATPHYFGATKFKDGKMVRFVQRTVSKYSAEDQQKLANILAAVSAEAQLKSQRGIEQQERDRIAEGRTLLSSGEMRCTECHQFHRSDEDATAPDLTGYGSREWLTGIISDPAHPRFYGDRNDKMPKFGTDKVLDAETIQLVVSWLRGEWYEPNSSEGNALNPEADATSTRRVKLD